MCLMQSSQILRNALQQVQADAFFRVGRVDHIIELIWVYNNVRLPFSPPQSRGL